MIREVLEQVGMCAPAIKIFNSFKQIATKKYKFMYILMPLFIKQFGEKHKNKNSKKFYENIERKHARGIVCTFLTMF